MRIRIHVRRSLHVHDDCVERAALRAVDDDRVGRENLESGATHRERLLLPSGAKIRIRRTQLKQTFTVRRDWHVIGEMRLVQRPRRIRRL